MFVMNPDRNAASEEVRPAPRLEVAPASAPSMPTAHPQAEPGEIGAAEHADQDGSQEDRGQRGTQARRREGGPDDRRRHHAQHHEKAPRQSPNGMAGDDEERRARAC